MSVWSLAAAAMFTGMTVGVGTQDAAVAQGGGQSMPAPAVEIAAQQRVSVSFNHAGVGEVLDWLSKNGGSFVAADSELPKDATVTMSIKDAPIEDVMDAIASALGGHWERRGDVSVFRKGEGFDFAFGGDGPGRMRTFNMGPGNAKVFGMPRKNGEMPKFRTFTVPEGGFAFSMPDMKNFDMPEMKEFKVQDMEKMRAELKEQLKDLPEMTPEARKEMEESMRAAQKAWADSGESWKVSKKAMEQARKEMEKARKEHPELFKEGQPFFYAPGSDKGKLFQYRVDGKDGDRVFIAPEMGKDGPFQYRINSKGKGDHLFMTPGFSVDGVHDLTKLLDSLTPDQKDMNRRQGFIRASDLTPAQRRMIGISDKSKDWTIKINKDGREVTIKSDK